MGKQDDTLKFRLPRDLKEQAFAKAKREGIALSEAIRLLLATWAKDAPPETRAPDKTKTGLRGG